MQRDAFHRFQQRYPHARGDFYARLQLGRRELFRTAAGVAGSFLLPGLVRGAAQTQRATPRGTARHLIFVLMSGGPSHTDTFDLKMIDGISPAELAPERINGILWPTGLFPKLGAHLPSMAILRSMRAWALVHETGQRWVQIGRNPAGAEGSVAPHIGSIIAREKERERRATDSFPPFLALDVTEAAGEGYFSARYAPFKYRPSATGVPDTTHRDGEAVFQARQQALDLLDGPLRGASSPLGVIGSDLAEFYAAAAKMMHNPAVAQAFRVDAGERERYGSTAFGDACLVARQALAADQGTRVIMIRLGGWDSHSNIYSASAPTSHFAAGRTFDNAMAALLTDLQTAGLLEETLVVAGGEFGRTPGPLSAVGGRDHYLQQSFLLMGGGVRGGRAIGATDAGGEGTVETGWSRDRDIRIEDVEATIYSALGIDWTTVLQDSPVGAFAYVPHSDKDVYGPIHELWG